MSKLTREERLAQGWRECWGVWSPQYGWWTGTAVSSYSLRPSKRHAFNDERGAWSHCIGINGDRIRRFWRRAKPKPAAPELKVGDLARLELQVSVISIDDDGHAVVRTWSGRAIEVTAGSLRRHP